MKFYRVSAVPTSYEVDGNRRDSVTGRLDAMSDAERSFHRAHAADIDQAAAAGKLRNYKPGKKTPLDCRPSFEKSLPNT